MAKRQRAIFVTQTLKEQILMDQKFTSYQRRSRAKTENIEIEKVSDKNFFAGIDGNLILMF